MTVIEASMDALLLAALQVLLACWIQIRLRASIKHEYDKKLEEFKREHERREKAAVIAEFMAEWTHIKDSDTKKLNQLLWELTLYLPSHLVKDINAMSTKAPGAKTPSQVLVAVRSYLLNDADRITEDDVTHFKHPGNASMYSSSQR